jgi:hypothetical protein
MLYSSGRGLIFSHLSLVSLLLPALYCSRILFFLVLVARLFSFSFPHLTYPSRGLGILLCVAVRGSAVIDNCLELRRLYSHDRQLAWCLGLDSSRVLKFCRRKPVHVLLDGGNIKYRLALNMLVHTFESSYDLCPTTVSVFMSWITLPCRPELSKETLGLWSQLRWNAKKRRRHISTMEAGKDIQHGLVN